MLTFNKIKTVLLQTGAFIDNSYLDKYIELFLTTYNYEGIYTEKHHLIPVSYYKSKLKVHPGQKL